VPRETGALAISALAAVHVAVLTDDDAVIRALARILWLAAWLTAAVGALRRASA
jgi:hypothetical protein